MTFQNTHRKPFISVRPDFLVCLFLVIVTLFVYWPVRNYSFVNYDDRQYVTNNHTVQSGLTLASIEWAFTAVHASNWHPLTWLSHMLDCQIYGMNPGPHHMTNVLLHVLNVLLLFFVLRKMTGDLWKSSFVAALFALHPLHVESVAWIAERKDVLSTFFWMLTVWSYLRYVERPQRQTYLPILLFFILGLMAKPMLVTLPFVLLLLDYWPLNRYQMRLSDNANPALKKPIYWSLIWEKLPLFLLSAASSTATYLVQKSTGAVNSLAAIPFHIRIANAMVSYVRYIGKMIWPHNLAILYPFPKSIPLWKFAGAGVLILGVSFIVFRLRKTRPYFAVGWFWYLGTLVPVIGIVQVGVQAMADRYTYVPLIGIFIMIAWGAPHFVPKWRYRNIGLSVFMTAILVILMITARMQLRYWSNSTTLFEHALDVTDDNGVAHLNLGEALAEQGLNDAAVEHYYAALKIKPDLVAAHLNLGVFLREAGKLDEAIRHFSMAIRLKSDCAEARYELGDTLAKKGDLTGAIQQYVEAIRIDPGEAKVYNKLGVILADQNKEKAAIDCFFKAIQMNPDYAGAYYNLGKIYIRQGNIEKAILHFKKALRLDPHMTEALFHLSWILATYGDPNYRNGKDAIELAIKLCKITQYRQALALDVLAAAYAETGKYNMAVSTAEKGLELALKQGPEVLVVGLKKRLKLYQQKRPYHETLSE